MDIKTIDAISIIVQATLSSAILPAHNDIKIAPPKIIIRANIAAIMATTKYITIDTTFNALLSLFFFTFTMNETTAIINGISVGINIRAEKRTPIMIVTNTSFGSLVEKAKTNAKIAARRENTAVQAK